MGGAGVFPSVFLAVWGFGFLIWTAFSVCVGMGKAVFYSYAMLDGTG